MFIELTYLDGSSFYVNVNHIILFRPDEQGTLIEINTKAHQNYYTVREEYHTVRVLILDALETGKP